MRPSPCIPTFTVKRKWDEHLPPCSFLGCIKKWCLYMTFFRHKRRIRNESILCIRTVTCWSRKHTFLWSGSLNAKHKCSGLAICVLHERHWKYVLSYFLVFPRKLEEIFLFFSEEYYALPDKLCQQWDITICGNYRLCVKISWAERNCTGQNLKKEQA